MPIWTFPLDSVTRLNGSKGRQFEFLESLFLPQIQTLRKGEKRKLQNKKNLIEKVITTIVGKTS